MTFLIHVFKLFSYLAALIFGAWSVSEGGEILGSHYDASILGGFIIAWLNTAPETIFFISALESNNPNFAIGAISGSAIVVCTVAVGACVVVGSLNRSTKSISLLPNVRKQAILLGASLIVPILVLIGGFQKITGYIGIGLYLMFVVYTLLKKTNNESKEEDENVNQEESDDEEEQPTWKGFLHLAIGGFVIYLFSEPFINTVVQFGTDIKLNPIVLAFFFAPIASEAPEILESISLSRKGKLQNINIAFSNLVGGTISKTTLLLGILCFYGINKDFVWNSPQYSISMILVIICSGSTALFGFSEIHSITKGYLLLLLFTFCSIVQFVFSYFYQTATNFEMFKKKVHALAKDSLSLQMKSIEKLNNFKVDSTKPFIIRLDGNNFSKFTKPFLKPFDSHLHEIFVQSSCEIFDKYSPKVIYCCSDEITIMYDGFKDERFVPLAGRIQKISSLFSSYFTIYFNKNLNENLNKFKDYKTFEDIKKNINKGAAFDARVFNLENEDLAFKNIIWRSKHDCVRNSKHLLGCMYFSQKYLNNLNPNEIIRRVKEQYNVDWNDFPSQFKYGYMKKMDIIQ
eukprot:gene368-6782_t